MSEYVFDFETNTTEETCGLNPVWAWGYAAVDDPENTYLSGTSINSFIDFIENKPGRYWAHNVGFDAKFVLDYIMKRGYMWVDGSPNVGEFTTIIDRTGKFYSVTIRFESGEVVLADSYKKITMPLRAVASAYGLEMSKGDIDYNIYRPPGHELTNEEADYLKRDVLILAYAMQERLKFGEKLTTGSDCLALYKDLVGGESDFKKKFPRLNKTVDEHIRQAYRGGFVFVNPIHQNKVVGSGISLDVNSMYPAMMRYRPLPWGVPVFEMGAPKDRPTAPLWVGRVTFDFEIKAGCIPAIIIKDDRHYNPREYLYRSTVPVTIWVSSVDWELYNELYDITVYSWFGCYYFKAETGMFDDYVDSGIYGKMHAENSAERTNYKFQLNNLYGKFGQKIKQVSKIPYLEDDRIKYKESEPDERDPVYIPVATFVTAYARKYLIETAMTFGDRYLYSDTDSIKALGEDIPDGIKIDSKELGYWDVEEHFDRAIFIRPKTYATEHDGSYTYKCAGMTDGLKKVMRFDDFRVGFTTDRTIDPNVDERYTDESIQKLVPRIVPGGVILEPRPFTIRK